MEPTLGDSVITNMPLISLLSPHGNPLYVDFLARSELQCPFKVGRRAPKFQDPLTQGANVRYFETHMHTNIIPFSPLQRCSGRSNKTYSRNWELYIRPSCGQKAQEFFRIGHVHFLTHLLVVTFP